jgi:hypothetical protein
MPTTLAYQRADYLKSPWRSDRDVLLHNTITSDQPLDITHHAMEIGESPCQIP